MKRLIALPLVLFLSVVSASCLPAQSTQPATQPTTQTSEIPTFYADYAQVLQQHVDAEGMVDYESLKANRAPLDRFAEQLADLEPDAYQDWTRDQKIAFWINAYNALTLEVIIDNYPIDPGLIRNPLYPANSIRQIEGVWDEIRFDVMDRELTLDQIEHEILRPQFNEPRIHMAINCASIGCPELRREPFMGKKLDRQLNEQAEVFFNDPTKFQIDPENKTIRISPIFDWFGEDFIEKMKAEGVAEDPSKEEATLWFASHYVGQLGWPEARDYRIAEYLDYDWALNDQTAKE